MFKRWWREVSLIGGKIFVYINHLMNNDWFLNIFHEFKGEKNLKNPHFKKDIQRCWNLFFKYDPTYGIFSIFLPFDATVLSFLFLQCIFLWFSTHFFGEMFYIHKQFATNSHLDMITVILNLWNRQLIKAPLEWN